MIRPQQKQRRDHEERLRNLRRGDEVVTAGGIVGKVVHIAETKGEGKSSTMDDRITIKSDESRLIVERGRIARVVTVAEPASTPAPASKQS
jgi:preprotein translocase subunit YajC